MRLLIRQPQGQPLKLPRDHIALGVAPPVRAGVTDGGNGPTSGSTQRERLNYFPGRALTAPALALEQRHRAFHLAMLNRTLSPGVVDGLAVAIEAGSRAAAGSELAPPGPVPELLQPRRLRLTPGMALDAQGEELELPTELGFDLLDLPLAAPAWLLDGAPPPTGSDNELFSRNVGLRLRDALAAGRPVPRVGVLLLQAIEYDLLLDPDGSAAREQCERDPEAEAFDDEVRQEGGRLLFYPWPEEWLALPAPGRAWRNQLAHAVFAREAELGLAQAMPWWRLGVPLALLACNPAWQPAWADASAVRRRGGAPRALPPRVAGGSAFLWQARVDQLTEHLADAAGQGAEGEQLGLQLRTLPPCGLLPRDAIDARRHRSRWLPPTLRLDAAPIPLEQLDAVLEAAAPSAPIDLAFGGALRVLVPVPQAQFEPDLLLVERVDADGSFERALSDLTERRADQLRRRQVLRERLTALGRAAQGVNAPDLALLQTDPQRLEDESALARTPIPLGDLHVSARLGGMHQHFLTDAPTPLPVSADDTLYAWVMLNAEAPPRQVMLQFFVNGQWEQRAFWGDDLISWGQPGTPSRLRMGALPDAGEWTRLTVPARSLGLLDAQVTGIAFTLFDGQAVWGPAGVLGRVGPPVTASAPPPPADRVWVDRALIDGSRRWANGDEWSVLFTADHPAPFEPSLGTVPRKADRIASLLVTLRDDPAVGGLRLGAQGQQQPLSTLLTNEGLNGAAQALRRAIDRGNDQIDFGFVRVQADMYRLRQSVLKQSQATRFAVSPALSQIADLDSAAASREQLSGFFSDIKGTQVSTPPAPRDGPQAFTAAAELGRIAIEVPPQSPLLMSVGASAKRVSAVDAKRAAALVQTQSAERLQFNIGQVGNILGGDALTGVAEVRNVTIAARMEQPRAVENKNFALSTRIEVTQRLLQSEFDLSEIQVAGVPDGGLDAATGQPKRKTMPLLGLVDVPRLLTDPSPDAAKADEAHYFLGGVDVADFTIGLLRNIEGLTLRYRAALTRVEQGLSSLSALQLQGQQRLRELETALAETRQDVATARALLAEDTARVNAINARRDGVIQQHVRFLAFVRPLLAPPGQRSPTRALDNAFEPDAVPACLASHGPPPPEVQAMVAQLRRAPVQWFTGLQRLPTFITRPEQIRDLVLQLGQSLAVNPAPPAPPLTQQLLTGVALQLAQTRQAKMGFSWQPQMGVAEQRAQVFQHLVLDDFMPFPYLAPLQSWANSWFDRVASVAGCLHARLSQVKPALRLGWAEAYSSFDGAVELGDLSALPRLHEVPQELREDITELAAWLRRQAPADNPLAQALLNTLVRVCLLAASQSPTQTLISGSVLRPMPLLPLAVLPVRPHFELGVFLGQRVEVMEADRVVALGVVQDFNAGQADVRIERAFGPSADAGPNSRVRFLA
jgi:hypothetical protein